MASTWIVVPCFNEAKRLDPPAFIRFVRGSADVRLLFVDDGSTDGTARVLDRLCTERPEQVERLSLSTNCGKGEAVRAGMLHAIVTGAGYAGYWDADLSTPLDAAHRFIQILDGTPWLELVMGSRVQLLGRQIERRALRHYLGRGFATAASLAAGLRVYDTQCGAKLFRVTPGVAALFAQPFVSRWTFDVEILARMVLQRKGTGLPPAEEVIREEPLVEWRDRGGSKLTVRGRLRAGVDLLHIAYAMSRSRRNAGAVEFADVAPQPSARPAAPGSAPSEATARGRDGAASAFGRGERQEYDARSGPQPRRSERDRR